MPDFKEIIEGIDKVLQSSDPYAIKLSAINLALHSAYLQGARKMVERVKESVQRKPETFLTRTGFSGSKEKKEPKNIGWNQCKNVVHQTADQILKEMEGE